MIGKLTIKQTVCSQSPGKESTSATGGRCRGEAGGAAEGEEEALPQLGAVHHVGRGPVRRGAAGGSEPISEIRLQRLPQ